MEWNNDFFEVKIKGNLTNFKNNVIIFIVLILCKLFIKDSSVQTLLSFAIVIDVVLAVIGFTSKTSAIFDEPEQSSESMEVEIDHSGQPEEEQPKKQRKVRKIPNKLEMPNNPTVAAATQEVVSSAPPPPDPTPVAVPVDPAPVPVAPPTMDDPVEDSGNGGSDELASFWDDIF